MMASEGPAGQRCAQMAQLFLVIPSGGPEGYCPGLEEIVTIKRRVCERHTGPSEACMGASGCGRKLWVWGESFWLIQEQRTTLTVDHSSQLLTDHPKYI